MMKKIKSIEQLQAEKDRIAQQQQDISNKIGSNWKDLKESLRPVNIAKDIFSSVLKSRAENNLNDGNVLKNTFNYGLSLLAKKIAEKLGSKFGNFSEK